MSAKGINMGLVFMVLVTMLWATANAQSNCTNVIIGMAPCLNFVTGSSSTPSASCCSQLGSVVQSQPQCLCMVLNGGSASPGVTINQTLALALPGACNVQTPPVNKCNAANGSASSPFGPPVVGSPQGLPGGSKTVPSTGTSDVVTITVPLQFVLFFVLMAAYASTTSSF